MKPLLTISMLALLLALAPTSARGENSSEADAKQMLILVKAVQAQQAVVAANQIKIEEKIATVAETVRVARIYSSRGGR